MRPHPEPTIDLAPRTPDLERQLSGAVFRPPHGMECPVCHPDSERSLRLPALMVGAFVVGAGGIASVAFVVDVVRGALVWMEMVRP